MSASQALAPRSPSVPIPPLASLRAGRVVTALALEEAERFPAIHAAWRRPPARNTVAAARLMAALHAALPGAQLLRGRQSALLSRRWAGKHLLTAFGGEMPGIACLHLVVLAGKRLDRRVEARLLEATPHALGRFLQRSGRDEAALMTALAEAATHAGRVLLGALHRDSLHRLRGGTTPILLPAGEGAFLGYLRLLPGITPRPHIECGTWVHRFDLADSQLMVREALLAGAAPEALPPFLGLLQPNAAGDSRLLGGLPLAGWAKGRDLMDELRILASPPALAARLALGEDPEKVSEELRGLR